MTFGGKKINKTDRKHLREMHIYTKYMFQEQVRFLKAERDKDPSQPYRCYDCVRIARKLDMWGDNQ